MEFRHCRHNPFNCRLILQTFARQCYRAPARIPNVHWSATSCTLRRTGKKKASL